MWRKKWMLCLWIFVSFFIFGRLLYWSGLFLHISFIVHTVYVIFLYCIKIKLVFISVPLFNLSSTNCIIFLRPQSKVLEQILLRYIYIYIITVCLAQYSQTYSTPYLNYIFHFYCAVLYYGISTLVAIENVPIYLITLMESFPTLYPSIQFGYRSHGHQKKIICHLNVYLYLCIHIRVTLSFIKFYFLPLTFLI